MGMKLWREKEPPFTVYRSAYVGHEPDFGISQPRCI